MDMKSSPSSEHLPPPVPQRSHARVASTNAPTIMKRPGVAPLLTGGNDISRSRSETASSSASLRQRRQGFVPTRKPTPTNDMNRVSELSEADDNRVSSASTIKAAHSRQSSSLSTRSGFLAASSGGSSSGAVSPIDGPSPRFVNGSRLSSLPENRDSRVQPKDTVKAAKRLRFTLKQLFEPTTHVATAIKETPSRKSSLERSLFTANAHLEEIARLLDRLDGFEDGKKQISDSMKAIARACLNALDAHTKVAMELKRSVHKIAASADGIYTRGLLFQVYSSMTEARNICSVLGFQLRPAPLNAGESVRVSTAGSSKTVTPTQQKPNTTSRQRGATILQSMASDATLRAMPPPPVPSANASRSSTMTSTSGGPNSALPTPRSGESFSSFSSARPGLPRSNTVRTLADEERDDQFENIHKKLKQASDLAGEALPQCRNEFAVRMQTAQSEGQSRMTARWKTTLSKCDVAISNNKALKKRLESARLNDPGVRHSKEFWQLCDGFVHVSALLHTRY